MRNQNFGAAIAQDVACLGRLEVPVQRHEICAKLARREHDLDQRGIITQHERERVAVLEADARQKSGRTRSPRRQILRGEFMIAERQCWKHPRP